MDNENCDVCEYDFLFCELCEHLFEPWSLESAYAFYFNISGGILTHTVITVAYMFIAMYPCVFLCYSFFMDKLARPFKRIAAETALLCILLCLLGIGINEISITIFDYYLRYIYFYTVIAFFIVFFIYFTKTVRENSSKLLFVFFLAVHVFVIISAMQYTLFHFLHDIHNIWFDLRVMEIILRLTFYPVAWLIIRRLFVSRVNNVDPRNIKLFWLMPMTFSLIIAPFMVISSYVLYFTLTITMFLGTTIFSFCLYYLLLKTIERTTENTRLESDILHSNQQIALQGEHYKMLRTHIDDTKRARHDLRQHLSAFKSYIETGETEKLEAYINEYSSSLPDDTEITFCENYAVNSILRHYIGIAKSEGIKVDVHTELPENAGVNDSDLCIIFGNCLENAIEACRWIEDTEKFINISSKTIGSMLAVTIDNSFDGVIKQDNGIYLSRKRDGEGIGIASVKAVALKYGIEACFEIDGNVFRAEIMLRRSK